MRRELSGSELEVTTGPTAVGILFSIVGTVVVVAGMEIFDPGGGKAKGFGG
jgi:hypothetical protein